MENSKHHNLSFFSVAEPEPPEAAIFGAAPEPVPDVQKSYSHMKKRFQQEIFFL